MDFYAILDQVIDPSPAARDKHRTGLSNSNSNWMTPP